MTEEIVRLACLLGQVESSKALEVLCQSAQGELEGLLRPGLTPQDCGGAFPLAAAWLALAALEESGEGEVSAFTAGDVSIRRQTGEQRAQILRRRAREALRGCLRDEGFAFRSVRGL